ERIERAAAPVIVGAVVDRRAGDDRRRGGSLDAELVGERGEVEVELVPEQPARRRVRRVRTGLVEERREDRERGDVAPAAPLDLREQLAQVPEVAGLAALDAGEPVDRREHAPAPRAGAG